MILVKKVDKNNLYTDFVNIINGVLQLSKREAEVFSFLLYVSDNGFEHNVNDKEVRTQIMSKLGISEANLSRYLNTIKSKHLIVRNDLGKWVINEHVKPTLEEGVLDIKFELKVQSEESDGVKISGQYAKE